MKFNYLYSVNRANELLSVQGEVICVDCNTECLKTEIALEILKSLKD